VICSRSLRGPPQHLHAGGWLLLEHGFDQAVACAWLLEAAGFQKFLMRLIWRVFPRVSGGRLDA